MITVPAKHIPIKKKIFLSTLCFLVKQFLKDPLRLAGYSCFRNRRILRARRIIIPHFQKNEG